MTSIDEWLNAANRFPLLTAEEELLLARQVQVWLIHPPPVPAPVERRGQRARRRMIEANLRLVHNCWKRYGSQLPTDPVDLLQEGAIGLARAVEKFNPAKGYKFSTYAYWWIRQAMGRVGQRGGGAIRLPSTVSELKRRFRDGENLQPSELERLRAMLAAQVTVALEASIRHSEQDGSLSLLDILPAGGADPFEQLEADTTTEQVLTALVGLPPMDRQAMELLWGLSDGHEHTARQVAQLLGIRIQAVQGIAVGARQRVQAMLNGSAVEEPLPESMHEPLPQPIPSGLPQTFVQLSLSILIP